MSTFKKISLQIFVPIPKRLSTRIEQKQSHCIISKSQIREVTLGQTMPTFGKKEVKQAIERYKGRFTPRNRAFKLFRNKF